MTFTKPFARLATGALVLATLGVALPEGASAHGYYRYHRYHHYRHYSDCRAARHRHATNGAIIGAIGGGIVGNAMSSGNRGPGTLLGAGVGALAGHEIGKNSGC